MLLCAFFNQIDSIIELFIFLLKILFKCIDVQSKLLVLFAKFLDLCPKLKVILDHFFDMLKFKLIETFIITHLFNNLVRL